MEYDELEYDELKKILEGEHINEPSYYIEKGYSYVCTLLISCGLFNINEKNKYGFKIFNKENLQNKSQKMQSIYIGPLNAYNLYTGNKKRDFSYIECISENTHTLFTFLNKGDVTSSDYKEAKKNLISFVQQNEDIKSCITNNGIPTVQLVDALTDPNGQNPIYIPSFACDILSQTPMDQNKMADCFYSGSHASIKLIDIFSDSNPEDSVRKNTLFKPLINNIFKTTRDIHYSSLDTEKKQLQENLYDLLVEYIELKTVLFDRPIIKHSEAYLYTFDVIVNYMQFLDGQHVIGLLKRFFEQYENVIASYENEKYESIPYKNSLNILRLTTAKRILANYSLLNKQYSSNNPNNKYIDFVLKYFSINNESYMKVTKVENCKNICHNFTISTLLGTDPNIEDAYLCRIRHELSLMFTNSLLYTQLDQVRDYLLSFLEIRKKIRCVCVNENDKCSLTDTINQYISDVLCSNLHAGYKVHIMNIICDFIPKRYIKLPEFLYLTLVHTNPLFFKVICYCDITSYEYSQIKIMIENSELDDNTKKRLSGQLNKITKPLKKRIMVACTAIGVALSFPLYIFLAFLINAANNTFMQINGASFFGHFSPIILSIILFALCGASLRLLVDNLEEECYRGLSSIPLIDPFEKTIGYNEIPPENRLLYHERPTFPYVYICYVQKYILIFIQSILIIPSLGLIFSGIFTKMNSVFFALEENVKFSNILSPVLGSIILVILVVSLTANIYFMCMIVLFDKNKVDKIYDENKRKCVVNYEEICENIYQKPLKLEPCFENKVELYQHQDNKPEEKQNDFYEEIEVPPSYDEAMAIESTFSHDNRGPSPIYHI